MIIKRLIIITNDKEYANIFCEYFESEYEVLRFEDVAKAKDYCKENRVEIVVCEINYGSITASHIAEMIHRYQKEAKVVCLINCFESLLNEFIPNDNICEIICKKVNLSLVKKRLNNLLELKVLQEKIQSSQYKNEEVEIEIKNNILYSNGKMVDMTLKELMMVQLFLENKNKVISRKEIVQELCLTESKISQRTADTHVKNIRKKLNKSFIKTIRGQGYILIEKKE